MRAYYNDNDSFCCAWLSNLMDAGLITAGTIDDRSIEDVNPDNLNGYERVHFFAGIGGWDYALNLAGWQGPVWTGSCPCQPLSSAGKQRGHADKRHLWPALYELIEKRRPPVVFGEQVASPLGREWLAGIRLDMEDVGYACGAADLCAAGVGAPHIRQRLWWVAESESKQPHRGWDEGRRGRKPTNGCAVNGLADSGGERRNGQPICLQPREQGQKDFKTAGCRNGSGLGNTNRTEEPRQRSICIPMEPEQETGRPGDATPWSQAIFIQCADGKARRIEPEIFPLADGVSNRVGILRGSGNAINPQIAAEFIAAYVGI